MGEVAYRYNSADNHLNLRWVPGHLWQERLPARYRDVGPKVVETDQGSFWSWEGRLHGPSADGSSHAKLKAHSFPGIDVSDGQLPPADPRIVRRHMDMAGVHGAIFYGDSRKWGVEDPGLRLAMHRAFNDFALELSAHEPDRLVWLPLLPSSDPAECLEELRRVTDRGARAVELSMFDLGAPVHDPAWEPLWAEAEERDIVVCSHTGHGAGTQVPPNVHGIKLAHHATSPFVAAQPIAQMVFSGVFQRHPRLQWVMAECRIGWLPFLFSWMDRQTDVRASDPTYSLSMKPSEYVIRNVRFTFEDDMVGARLLAEDWSLLKDTVLWGCDYPHPQLVWPDPDAKVERLFAGVSPEIRHEIVFARTARLFGLAPLPGEQAAR